MKASGKMPARLRGHARDLDGGPRRRPGGHGLGPMALSFASVVRRKFL